MARFYVQDQGIFIPTNDLAQSFAALNFKQTNSLGIGTDTITALVNPSNPNWIADIEFEDLWGFNNTGEIYRMTPVGIGTVSPTYFLEVNGTLGVSSAVYFKDTLTVDDETNLNNTLDVDGATTLNDSLVVSGFTTLKSTLEVDGATTLNLTLSVEEETTLNSTLTVEGSTKLNDDLNVVGITTIENTSESTDTDSGALQVKGGVGIKKALNVEGDITTENNYFGQGETILGIVTQINPSIGIHIKETQLPGKGIVTIDAYTPVGRTVYVSMNGNDNNTGLAENHTKRTIKSAASVAIPGDTIKVFPGSYVEDNPIILAPTVSLEGTELRNVTLTPRYPNRDFFYVNNGCHITDASFIGPPMATDASIVSFQPLEGVQSDRFFDAARMIRQNLDFIAYETVGYLTSTQYRTPAFTLGINTTTKCANDIRSIWKAICFDITRGGNSKSVGAGLSYYNGNLLQHIVGVKTETIDAFRYSFEIARAVVNNCTWGGKPIGSVFNVTNAQYSNVTGIVTITTNLSHNLNLNNPVKIQNLLFSCPSGPTQLLYPTGNFGFIFPVRRVISNNSFEVVVGKSTLQHTYVSGGTVQRFEPFQNNFTQVKDLAIQVDSATGFNNSINSCQNVISAMNSCIGVITNVVGYGQAAFAPPIGIKTNYPGNSGRGFDTLTQVTSATYDNEIGQVIINAPGYSARQGEIVEVRDLVFSCSSGLTTTTQNFPSGKYGYEFYVYKVNPNGSFILNVGVSTIPHTYVSGGYVVNRSKSITNAVYSNTTGIVTITSPGTFVRVGDVVNLSGLGFTCPSGPGIVTYPSGNLGYDFRVIDVTGIGNTFSAFVGVSTLPHTYVSGGIIKPPYSRGVGNITQGPYVRNCTNFIANSIGMKVDGFAAEPGDQEDIGVTGAMSVDSYTQYNQGGIGVSITNGSYCQLVSIFTICDDIAIYTGSGGQCDITNSNSSFGRLGLVAESVGNNKTKSIYRYTGEVAQLAEVDQDTVIVSGVGSNRPYDGQALYFGELYYSIQSIEILNQGSGYSLSTGVIIEFPLGQNGIPAEALATIENGAIISIDLISSGSQFTQAQVDAGIQITFTGGGSNAVAKAVFEPIYYNIETATLPASGISTITLTSNLNSTVSVGTTVYFSRLSLQIASSHSFEWVGAGNDIFKAKPGLGGVVITDNEVVKIDGGQVVYTSTDQAGNFKIGDDFTINQLTGTVSGRAFNQSLLNTITPVIIALGN